MEIIEENAGLMTNVEALLFLKELSKGSNVPNEFDGTKRTKEGMLPRRLSKRERVLYGKVTDFLDQTPCSVQNHTHVSEMLRRVHELETAEHRDLKKERDAEKETTDPASPPPLTELTKLEKLQLINCLLRDKMQAELAVEEIKRRFSAEEIDRIMEIVCETLPEFEYDLEGDAAAAAEEERAAAALLDGPSLIATDDRTTHQGTSAGRGMRTTRPAWMTKDGGEPTSPAAGFGNLSSPSKRKSPSKKDGKMRPKRSPGRSPARREQNRKRPSAGSGA